MVLVQNVSKLYRLYDKPSDRLREILPFRRRRYHEDFWALKNVTVQVGAGEILGIVGPNGSGKSTLLQVAAEFCSPHPDEYQRRAVLPLCSNWGRIQS